MLGACRLGAGQGGRERIKVPAALVADPVDEERGRTTDPARDAAQEVLPDTREVGSLPELPDESGHIELDGSAGAGDFAASFMSGDQLLARATIGRDTESLETEVVLSGDGVPR